MPKPKNAKPAAEPAEEIAIKAEPLDEEPPPPPNKKSKLIDGEQESDESTTTVVKNEIKQDLEPASSPVPIKSEVKSEGPAAEASTSSGAKPATKPERYRPSWFDLPKRPKKEGPEHVTSMATLGPFLAKHDNWKNYDYITPIPQICKDEPCMLGVDEAGRGPVLGPMVYGIAFCPLSQSEHLKTLGCADSKQLSEADRERIFDDLCTKPYANSNIGWAIDVISPSHISGQMLSRVKVSLNEISMLSAIGLINKAIAAGVNIAEVYVDTVGPPASYQARLSALFPDFQITVAKKADSTYPIVSAASICAKVTRDVALREWVFPEGLKATYKDFGSGYPGDPKTKAFLEDNVDRVFGFPRIVRFSWSTAQKVLERKACRLVFPDNDEEREKKAKAAQSIKKFMKPAAVVGDDGLDENGEPVRTERCQYWKDRHIEWCYEI